MCLQDIQIGDATQGRIAAGTVGATSIPVCPQSSYRRALYLGPPRTGSLTYNLGSDAVLNNGINILAGQAGVTLLYDHFGDVIQEAVFVIGDAAGRSFCVMEGLFYKERLKK